LKFWDSLFPLLKIKKNFRSRLLIRFNNRFFMQKKISKVLNGLKISPKIKLMVDVDPINFA
jgi:Primosomal protein N'' (replication factor Y) - superfamily II helicase